MPEFDLTSLPSLDSITAATDIRAFLTPGVPKEIARAALRRAWSADPAIRDFVGLAENAWDFTAPDAVAGFGALPPGYDVKKLVAQIFGESGKETDSDTTASNPTRSPAAPPTANIAGKIATPAASADAASSSPVNQLRDAPTEATGEESAGAIQSDGNFVRRDNNNIASHNNNSSNEIEDGKKRRPHGGALPQ
jgi:hypothetical protein